jgi:hypothetical protein
MVTITFNPRHPDVLASLIDRVPEELHPFIYPNAELIRIWIPPIGGRFFDYGPEDESWAARLGLGEIRFLDLVRLRKRIAVADTLVRI